MAQKKLHHDKQELLTIVYEFEKITTYLLRSKVAVHRTIHR